MKLKDRSKTFITVILGVFLILSVIIWRIAVGKGNSVIKNQLKLKLTVAEDEECPYWPALVRFLYSQGLKKTNNKDAVAKRMFTLFTELEMNQSPSYKLPISTMFGLHSGLSFAQAVTALIEPRLIVNNPEASFFDMLAGYIEELKAKEVNLTDAEDDGIIAFHFVSVQLTRLQENLVFMPPGDKYRYRWDLPPTGKLEASISGSGGGRFGAFFEPVAVVNPVQADDYAGAHEIYLKEGLVWYKISSEDTPPAVVTKEEVKGTLVIYRLI